MKDAFITANEYWENKNPRMAFITLKSGVSKGCTSCLHNLGYFYEEGIGTKCDINKAIKLYAKSARAGNPASAFNLGLIFKKKNSFFNSRKWFSYAKKLGDEDAEIELKRLQFVRHSHGLN